MKRISFDKAVNVVAHNYSYAYGGGAEFYPGTYGFDAAATVQAAIKHARDMGCPFVAVYERIRLNDYVGSARLTPARQVGKLSVDDDWTTADHGPGCDGPLNCTCSASDEIVNERDHA